MAYATITQARRLAGFTGNTNIADAVVYEKVRMAEGVVNGYVGEAYSVPLDVYYRQTITFSGTGSGNATLSLTIDGTVYSIAVTNGLTASAAADLFRAAADVAANTSFITDGVGGGTVVTMNSYGSGDSDQVNVTANNGPQGGITATVGTTPTKVAPPLIESLAAQVAAAFLLIEEYGPEAQDTDKDGFKKMEALEKLMEKIQKKTIKIYDFAGNEITTNTLYTPSFLPNDTTSDPSYSNPTDPKFTMNKKF